MPGFDPKRVFLEEWARFTLEEVEPQLSADAIFNMLAYAEFPRGAPVDMLESEFQAFCRAIVIELKTDRWKAIERKLKDDVVRRSLSRVGLECREGAMVDVASATIRKMQRCECPSCQLRRELEGALQKASEEARAAAAKQAQAEKATRN